MSAPKRRREEGEKPFWISFSDLMSALMVLFLVAMSVALWAAAGSIDTDLSFLSFLELYGTEIAERRMPARRVVEALDVVEHI